MKIETEPRKIYDEYQKGISYNQNIDLYNTIERNENFYIGKHWEGLNVPDIELVTIPMLANVVSHFVAMIVSDDVAVQISDNRGLSQEITDVFTHELEIIDEAEKTKHKRRKLIRNGAVDGDYCMYYWFDPDVETGQEVKGRIRNRIVENANIIFGNPQEPDVQEQPYVLIPTREMVDAVRDEAIENGVSEEDAAGIQEDTDPNEYNAKYSQGKMVTTITKLWKDPKTRTVRFIKVAQNVTIRKEVDTGYRLYPVAYASWEDVKNSYHGMAAITHLITNQIWINKMYSYAGYYVKTMSMQKIAYDKTKLPGGWPTKPNSAIAVIGDPNQAIAKALPMPEMSNAAFTMMDRMLTSTKEAMGASDVLTGNVNPDNTSAIVALTKNSAVPLELKKQTFYQFIEDSTRIVLDLMAAHYGMRNVMLPDEQGNLTETQFDFSTLSKLPLRLRIDVGQSAYWSELSQIQTADNMLNKGVLTKVQYLKALPTSAIRNRNELITQAEQEEAMQQAQQQAQAAAQGQPAQQEPQAAPAQA